MAPKKPSRRMLEEPTMSDKTLVLNIEDLISLSFGPLDVSSPYDFNTIYITN